MVEGYIAGKDVETLYVGVNFGSMERKRERELCVCLGVVLS